MKVFVTTALLAAASAINLKAQDDDWKSEWMAEIGDATIGMDILRRLL